MTTTTAHAPIPTVCAACEAKMHKLAEANPLDLHVLKRCLENAVIVLGFVRDGRIRAWQIEGPLTDEQAEATGARIMALMAAAGGTSHGVTEH